MTKPCPAVNIGCQINLVTGVVKPCCLMVLKQNTFGTLKKFTDISYFTSIYKKVRKVTATGRFPDECAYCRDMSKVLEPYSDFYDVTSPQLHYLDIFLSNSCGQQCRICSSDFSTAIAKEDKKYFKKIYPTTLPRPENVEIAKSLASEFKAGRTKHIKFFGGETLLIKETGEILEEIPKSLRNEFKIIIPTGGFYKLSNSLVKKNLDILSTFSGVTIGISIDDVGDKLNWIRYPVTMKHIIDAVKFLKSNYPMFTIELYSTIAWYNAVSVFDVGKLADELECIWNFNMLMFPSYFDSRNLPIWKKEWVLNNLAKVNTSYDRCIEMIKHWIVQPAYDTITWSKQWELDQIRRQNFFAVYPEHLDMKEHLI